ncbi:unnamed protein product [Coccothraustes coccothraustes]
MGYTAKLHCKATDWSHSEQERTNTAQHRQPFTPLSTVTRFLFRPSVEDPQEQRYAHHAEAGIHLFPEAGHTSAEALAAAQRLRKRSQSRPAPPARALPRGRRRTGEGAGQSPSPARRRREARGARPRGQPSSGRGAGAVTAGPALSGAAARDPARRREEPGREPGRAAVPGCGPGGPALRSRPAVPRWPRSCRRVRPAAAASLRRRPDAEERGAERPSSARWWRAAGAAASANSVSS